MTDKKEESRPCMLFGGPMHEWEADGADGQEPEVMVEAKRKRRKEESAVLEAGTPIYEIHRYVRVKWMSGHVDYWHEDAVPDSARG